MLPTKLVPSFENKTVDIKPLIDLCPEQCKSFSAPIAGIDIYGSEQDSSEQSSTSTSDCSDDEGYPINHTLAFEAQLMKTGSIKNHVINVQLVKAICEQFDAFDCLQLNVFKDFLKKLNHNYKLPSKKTIIRSLIPAVYYKTKNKIKSKLESAEAVCLILQAWNFFNSYIAVTANYLQSTESHLNLCTSLLVCTEFRGSLTPSNISDFLIHTAEQWDIKDKVVAVITDGSADVANAVHLSNWEHIPCFAISLNMIVQMGLGQIHRTFTKVRYIVGCLKKDEKAAETLKMTQKQMGLPQLMLKQDTLGRWDTTLDMLDKFLKCKKSIISTPNLSFYFDDTFRLCNSDWRIIVESVGILQLLKQFLDEIDGEKTDNVSKVSILGQVVIKRLNEMKDLSPEVEKMRNCIVEKMWNGFRDLESHPFVAQTVLLDPRFKRLGFQNLCKYNETCKGVEQVLRLISVPSPAQSEVSPETSSSLLWEEFDESIREVSIELSAKYNPSEVKKIEMENFLKDPWLSRTHDPLEWWNNRKVVYPHLYKLAFKRLCISNKTIPCERVVSKARKAFKIRGKKIEPSKLSQIIFLKANFTDI